MSRAPTVPLSRSNAAPLGTDTVPELRTTAVSLGRTWPTICTSSMKASLKIRSKPTAGMSTDGAIELRASATRAATLLMVPSITS